MSGPDDAPPLASVDDLTAEWCSRALGSTVTRCTVSPVGTGQVSDTVRLVLDYDPPGAGPPTLVAKVTAASPASRAAALATRTYEVEAAFYREMAASLPVRTPACHLAAHDPDTNAYTVLLEDLAPAEPGDQMAGCSPDEAALAITEMARLHGPRWGDPGLTDLAWLHRYTEGSTEGLASLVAGAAPGFVERFAGRLDPDVLALVERFVARIAGYVTDRPGPWTVVHGDFRVDNLLFGGERVAVVDWQTVSLGSGLADLAYFLGASLPVESRRAHERDLVEAYRRDVGTFDVELSFDECWSGYRRYAFGGILMAIVAAMLVERTDRGDLMFTTMANRHGRHALDLEAERLLPA